MNTSQNLTPEKYEEIKKNLENESLEQFPSLLQQARNLAKQAWISGTGVLQGKALLASADKAYKRLEICSTCEFFKENRCSKCGCFMDKKIHLELSQCPVNKWGPALQELVPQSDAQANTTRTITKTIPPDAIGKKEMEPIEIEKFSPEDQENIKKLAERSLFKYDGRFSYNEVEYQALFKKNAPTQYYIYEIPPSSGRRHFFDALTQEKRSQLMELAHVSKDPERPVEFQFDNVIYRVTVRSNKMHINLVREVQPSEKNYKN